MCHLVRFILTTAICLSVITTSAMAATDGAYTLFKLDTAVWDGTDANPFKALSSDYTYFYGDEEYLTYTLPASWQFRFYGQLYTQITVDTNGNIWFGTPGSAHNFALPHAGLGPVSATWNDDLSSLYAGGVFIQHLTAPERVVIEWQTETLTDEGSSLLNNFETVLFDNGMIRYDYKPFTALDAKDNGSGISSDDNSHYLSVSANHGSPTSYASPSSFLFTPLGTGNNLALHVYFAGTGSGMVTSNPSGVSCNTDCSAFFAPDTQVTLSPAASMYSLFSGWSGGGCSGTGNCVVTLAADVSVTASFSYDADHQVQSGTDSPSFYSTLQAAYDATPDGTTIKLWATTYSETLTCNRPVTVILQGGYDAGYTAIVGEPVLSGTLTVTDGTAVVDGLAIQ